MRVVVVVVPGVAAVLAGVARARADDWVDMALDGGPLSSHAACAVLDQVPLLQPGECRDACAAYGGAGGWAHCDAVNWFDGEVPRCVLLGCGDRRPLATALGGARVWARRACASFAAAACPARRCVVTGGVGGGGCAAAPLEGVPRTLHVLSMGRVGSSYVDDLVRASGLSTAFEPLAGTVEGSALLRDPLLGDRLRCVYDCGAACLAAARLRPGAAEAVSLSCAERTRGVKTTRVLDLAAVAAALPPRLRRETRYVLLLRDPRGIWASLREFKHWAIARSDFVCDALALQAATAPRLAAVAPLKVLFYEIWTRDFDSALCDLARWLGRSSLPTQWRAGNERGAVDAGAWATGLPATEVARLERRDSCQAYMHVAGYRLTASGRPTDYTALWRSPLRRLPVPEDQRAFLARPVDGCPAAPSGLARSKGAGDVPTFQEGLPRSEPLEGLPAPTKKPRADVGSVPSRGGAVGRADGATREEARWEPLDASSWPLRRRAPRTRCTWRWARTGR